MDAETKDILVGLVKRPLDSLGAEERLSLLVLLLAYFLEIMHAQRG